MAKICPLRTSITIAAPESPGYPLALARPTASERALSTLACKRTSKLVTK